LICILSEEKFHYIAAHPIFHLFQLFGPKRFKGAKRRIKTNTAEMIIQYNYGLKLRLLLFWMRRNNSNDNLYDTEVL
jgi:hypothetical protein